MTDKKFPLRDAALAGSPIESEPDARPEPAFRTRVRLAGDACHHCGTAVRTERHRPGWEPRPGQRYWFEWWLRCPKCNTFYMVETAKQFWQHDAGGIV